MNDSNLNNHCFGSKTFIPTIFRSTSFSSDIRCFSVVLILAAALTGCSQDKPVAQERYQQVDKLAETINKNLTLNPALELVTDIDHSKLAAEVGSSMPPSRVIIFSDTALESKLLKENQLIGVDLPLRVLAYEETLGVSKYIYNSFDYLLSRYKLDDNKTLRKAHDQAYTQALMGIDTLKRSTFDNDLMLSDGLITVDSAHDFDKTVSLVRQIIAAEDDTIIFGEVNYQKNAIKQAVNIRPTTLILFGAPTPGARAMHDALTLGLDAFCQKFLVWEDENGNVHLSYNDLLAIAERQKITKGIVLRLIDFRISQTFQSALEE